MFWKQRFVVTSQIIVVVCACYIAWEYLYVGQSLNASPQIQAGKQTLHNVEVEELVPRGLQTSESVNTSIQWYNVTTNLSKIQRGKEIPLPVQEQIPLVGQWNTSANIITQWYNVKTNLKHTIGYVTSAFLHHRYNFVYVDIIGIFYLRPKNNDFMCSLYFNTSINASQKWIKSEEINWGLNGEHHNKKYKVYMISCKIPHKWERSKPILVKLSDARLSDSDFQDAEAVSIQYSSKYKKYNFTICMKPTYGKYPTFENFLQFVELSRMFGANYFMIYTTAFYNLTKDVNQLIESYKLDGLLDIVEFAVPVDRSEIHVLGQVLALQDCIFRCRAHSKYVVYTDFDEFIVPLKQNNWINLMQKVSTSPMEKYSTYLFRNRFFGLALPENSRYANETFLVNNNFKAFLQTTAENQIWPVRSRSKYICDPEQIVSASEHFPWKTTGKELVVDVKDAYVFHYHRQVKTKSSVEDPRMLEFYTVFKMLAQKRLQKLLM